jgi:hypothetical protein
MTTYDAPVITRLLPHNGSLLIIGRSGRSSVAAYAATALSRGATFFEQKAQKRPVLLFNNQYGDRRIDARKALDGVTEYDGLYIACAGCGEATGAIGDRITANMSGAVEELASFDNGVIVYDDISEALANPQDALSAPKIVEAANHILANSVGCDFPLIATLNANPLDVLDGALRPLASMFDIVAHLDLIGDGAWGRLRVIKSRVGVTGFYCDFEILPVKIGLDADGRAVRAPAINPRAATVWADSLCD